MSEQENDLEKLSKDIAKQLANKWLKDLEEALLSLKPPKSEYSRDLIQGRVCSIIASLMLAHTIKILQIKKFPKDAIAIIADECVAQAFDFAKSDKFIQVQEH